MSTIARFHIEILIIFETAKRRLRHTRPAEVLGQRDARLGRPLSLVRGAPAGPAATPRAFLVR